MKRERIAEWVLGQAFLQVSERVAARILAKVYERTDAQMQMGVDDRERTWGLIREQQEWRACHLVFSQAREALQ